MLLSSAGEEFRCPIDANDGVEVVLGMAKGLALLGGLVLEKWSEM